MTSPINSQFYSVQRNQVTFKNPVSGIVQSAILDRQATAVFTCQVKNIPSSGILAGAITVNLGTPGAIANANADCIMVFVAGKKMVLQTTIGPSATVFDWALGTGNSINFTNSVFAAFSPSDQVEVITLSPANLTTGVGVLNRVTLTFNGTSISLPNPAFGGYVIREQFYNNVLVFKNGLFCAPGSEYFILNDFVTMRFSAAFTAPGTIEMYALNRSSKASRIDAPATLSAGSSLFLYNYPTLPFNAPSSSLVITP